MFFLFFPFYYILWVILKPSFLTAVGLDFFCDVVILMTVCLCWSHFLCGCSSLLSSSRSLGEKLAYFRLCWLSVRSGQSFLFSSACAHGSICRWASSVTLINVALRKYPQLNLGNRMVYRREGVRNHVSILRPVVFEITEVCATSAVSSLRSNGNHGSVVAELDSSHVLHGGTGPLMAIGQSGRGCWEQAVLGNDLAGGPGRMERERRTQS